MKRIFIGIILLSSFFTCFLSADEYSDFKNLEPEQQIQKLLDDYRYIIGNDGGQLTFKFVLFTYMLTEKSEEIKPILFKYFEMFDAPLYRVRTDRAFNVIAFIIKHPFFLLFSEDEKRQLAELYQKKADKYLKTYKKIDNQLIEIEIMINKFTDDIPIPLISDHVEWVLEKYTKLVGRHRCQCA